MRQFGDEILEYLDEPRKEGKENLKEISEPNIPFTLLVGKGYDVYRETINPEGFKGVYPVQSVPTSWAKTINKIVEQWE